MCFPHTKHLLEWLIFRKIRNIDDRRYASKEKSSTMTNVRPAKNGGSSFQLNMSVHLSSCTTRTQWMKIIEKVPFYIASEASEVYILSGQKFIKNGQFWVFGNATFLVIFKHCARTLSWIATTQYSVDSSPSPRVPLPAAFNSVSSLFVFHAGFVAKSWSLSHLDNELVPYF